jgi:hypothetical protein
MKGGRMFVLTVDQRRSRKTADAVPRLLERLNARSGLVLPFERTAGDEVQGLVEDPHEVTEIVMTLLRGSAWWVGLGVGSLERPLPDSARAGRGPAYVAAREAVEAAKALPAGVAVRGDERAAYVQSAFSLLAAVVHRRSQPGWEVVDLLDQGLRQVEVAERLGITPQAVSSRLRVAAWLEERDGRVLVSWLLSLSQEDAS